MAALHGERRRAVFCVLGTHPNPLGTVPAGVRLEIPVEFFGAQIAASDAARNLGDVEVELHAGLQLEWYLFRGTGARCFAFHSHSLSLLPQHRRDRGQSASELAPGWC